MGGWARFGSWWAVIVHGWLWWAFLIDGRLAWVVGDHLRMVCVVTRGRCHRLGPFMAGGHPGAVTVGWPGLLAMFGDGFVVGRRVVVAVGGVVGVVVVVGRKRQHHTL